jgi:hypothetical protein
MHSGLVILRQPIQNAQIAMRKLFSLFLFLTVAVQLHAQTNEASLVSPLINQYQSDETMLNRKYTLKRSDEYFKRMEGFYAEWQKQLRALPFNKLTVNERVDYILLKRDIKSDSAILQQQYIEFKNNIFTLPFTKTLLDFEAKRGIGAQQDGKMIQQQFEQLKESIQQTTKAVKNKDLIVTAVQASWAQQTVNQYLAVFTEAYKFYDGYDP